LHTNIFFVNLLISFSFFTFAKDSSGCLSYNIIFAEIKPVEPEQGNACEGKVYKFYIPHVVSPVPIYSFIKKTKNEKKIRNNDVLVNVFLLASSSK
jgi:hypothetical protein